MSGTTASSSRRTLVADEQSDALGSPRSDRPLAASRIAVVPAVVDRSAGVPLGYTAAARGHPVPDLPADGLFLRCWVDRPLPGRPAHLAPAVRGGPPPLVLPCGPPSPPPQLA